jgi:hypothetical protein
MIEFNINGKDYDLPDFLNIENYAKIFKIKDLLDDEYMKAKVINLVTGCPVDELIEAENHKVEYLATEIFDMVPKAPFALVDRFTYEGIEYGYLPSYKNITFGEFVDLDTLLTKPPEEMMDYMHIICAIMYRPIISETKKNNFKIEKYNQDTLNDRAELFKKLDVSYVLGGMFFFINFARIYTNHIPLSLTQRIKNEWTMIKLVWKFRKILWRVALKKDMDGMSLSTELQKIEYQNTIQSLRRQLRKY